MVIGKNRLTRSNFSFVRVFHSRLKNGPTNLHELVTDLNTKKRKRRTSFTPQALERLNDAFELNTHPSGVDMSTLAQQLNYDREVIRVW
jgi:class 6 POU domain transcription factor